MVGLLWFVALLNYLDRMILITMRSSIKETERVPKTGPGGVLVFGLV